MKSLENRPLEASSKLPTKLQYKKLAGNWSAPKSATVKGEKGSFEEFLADH